MLLANLATRTVASTSRYVALASSSSRHLSTSRSLFRPDDSDPSAPFNRPAPPSLPPKEQREFERLVKEKLNAPQFTSAQTAAASAPPTASGDPAAHPDARRKPSPDFEGDVNPVTGEVGGPKKEPLTWEREWSYGGRATDF